MFVKGYRNKFLLLAVSALSGSHSDVFPRGQAFNELYLWQFGAPMINHLHFNNYHLWYFTGKYNNPNHLFDINDM